MPLLSVKILKTINLDFAEMRLREDGIVEFWGNNDLDGLSINRIETLYVTMITLTENKPSPLFVATINHIQLNDEEKNMIAAKLPSCISACAIKEENTMIRFLVHTFNYLYKPASPIKMFKTEEEAIGWLKAF